MPPIGGGYDRSRKEAVSEPRHLLMHVYPRANPPHWRRSVEHLKARWSQFTGRRIVSVCFDDTTAKPDAVRAAFEPFEIELIAGVNNGLQEVNSFKRLLNHVRREPGITLYCHSKGCTHSSPAAASHLWCDAMAEACLDYPKLVDCALADHDVCGAFRSRQIIGSPITTPPYHFAGTWYWFRNAALFANDNWRSVDPFLWGAESYPGRRFPVDRSVCLFLDNAHTLHLYDPNFWSQRITPTLAYWRKSLAAAGLKPIVDPESPLGKLLRSVPILDGSLKMDSACRT